MQASSPSPALETGWARVGTLAATGMASSEDEQVPLTQRPETPPPRWEGLTNEEDRDPNELEEESDIYFVISYGKHVIL